MLTAAEIEGMIKDTGGVLVTHGAESTWGRWEFVPAGVLGADGRAEVLGSKPSVVIPSGILSAFAPDDGIDETITIHVPEDRQAQLGQPASKEWRVANVLPPTEHQLQGLKLRLMLTEVRG